MTALAKPKGRKPSSLHGQAEVVAEIRRRTPRRGMLCRLADELGEDPGNMTRYLNLQRPVPQRVAEQLGFRIAYVRIDAPADDARPEDPGKGSE